MMALFRSIAGGCLFFGLAFGCGCSQKQSEESKAIVINEFLASNQSGLEDGDGTKGDWIELKNLDIDGEVLEVGLHRVKVKAWDNSITTFPTSKLLELTFKNWRNIHSDHPGQKTSREPFPTTTLS